MLHASNLQTEEKEETKKPKTFISYNMKVVWNVEVVLVNTWRIPEERLSMLEMYRWIMAEITYRWQRPLQFRFVSWKRIKKYPGATMMVFVNR